jgi:hypothetical protein
MMIETVYKGGFKTCFVYMQLIPLIINLGEGGKDQNSTNLALTFYTYPHTLSVLRNGDTKLNATPIDLVSSWEFIR